MDIMAGLIRYFLYPLWMHKDGNKDYVKARSYYNYIDDLSPAELKEKQLDKLKKMLAHAYNNTNYYKNYFDKIKFVPSDLRDCSEIKVLPLLTKDLIRSHFDGLIAANIDKERRAEASTGGSTGVPMHFLRDKESLVLRKGQELYFDRWMSYETGDKTVLFVAVSHYDGAIGSLKAKLRNATCERTLRFDPHHITDDYMEHFVKEFKAFRPKIIKCFPNALAVFADYLNRKGVQLPSVVSISCTGENLYIQQREMFKKIFGGEVFEKYGTRESGVIACECKNHDGLHVFTEGVVMELVKDDGNPAQPGEMGRIVITDLFNKAMPLIRYEIGDMAVAADPSPCPCGCPLPKVKKILGRDRDIILDSCGNPKPGYLFVEAIKDLNLAAQIQVVQEDEENLSVNIVKKDGDVIDTAGITSRFQDIIGTEIKISFHFVPEIKRDPSGKFRYVMSKLRKY